MLRPAALAVAFLAALSGSAQAQAADPLDGKPVREIRLTAGLRPESVEIVRRHLATQVGAPFERTRLQEDRRRLDALRLFSRIVIEGVAEGDGVVVELDLHETLRLLPFVALSVTDENGVSAGPGFRGINLLGRGWLSSGTAQFGGTTAIGGRIERPTVTPRTWDLDAKVVYRSRRNELFDFDEASTTISGAAGWNWTSRVQVGGRAEMVWFDQSGSTTQPDVGDRLPALGGTFTYNDLDSQTNPHEGWLGFVDVGRQFGDASAWTLMLDGRRLQPLGDRSTVSAVGFAVFQSGDVGEELPEYLQFGIGGTNSVRGWALGSRVGKNQAIGTVEYTYAFLPVRSFTVAGLNLYGGLQVAAFGDVGLAWNEDPSAGDAIDGYGVGLRLLFPFVDVLRLDLAFGEPGAGARFSFGINLKADKQRDRVR